MIPASRVKRSPRAYNKSRNGLECLLVLIYKTIPGITAKRSNTRARLMSSKRQQASSFTRAVKSSIIKVAVVVAKELQAMHGMLRLKPK